MVKMKVKELTSRSNGWGNEYRAMKLTQFVRGWVNYFSLADMKKMMNNTNEWLRHRLRMVLWKQWKKVKTKFKNMKRLGIKEEQAWIVENMRNGYYFLGNHYIVKFALNDKTLFEMGFPFFKQCFLTSM